MRRIQIGLDYRPALLGHSGIPRAVRELVRALVDERSIAVHLFGHSWARCEAGAPVGARLFRRRIPGRALPWLAACGIGAERLCGDVELFHWTDYVFPPVGRRTPVVLTLHDCAFAIDPRFHGADTATLAKRTRVAIARAEVVVCPTAATAADARAHLGVTASKLRVIPFGADHAIGPTDTPPPMPRPFVLMLGTIEPRKNHLRAIAAWRSLGETRPDLVVVGRPGWECAAAVDALEREAATGMLHWLGTADDATVASLVAHAEVLLYPSLLEGFGFPPLEAMRHGVPVVCGDGAALREIAGAAAESCDARDPESIAHALRAALADRSAAADGRRRAHAARFTWRDCGLAHTRLYREVLGA